MPTDDSYLPFALTCVGICVPTYVLILIVNNPDNVRAMLAGTGLFFTRLSSCAAPKKSERLKERILEHKVQHPNEKRPTVRAAATHASLEARLSDGMSSDTSLRGSQGFLQATTRRMSQGIHNYLPGAGRRATQTTVSDVDHAPPTWQQENDELSRYRKRSSTIKFEEPLYAPTRTRTSDLQVESHHVPTRWRTAEPEGTTLQDRERSNTNPSPVSPGVSPCRPETNGTSTPPATAAVSLRPIRERSNSPRDLHQRSLLRRLSERFSPMQDSPAASESGSLDPREAV